MFAQVSGLRFHHWFLLQVVRNLFAYFNNCCVYFLFVSDAKSLSHQLQGHKATEMRIHNTPQGTG